MTNFKLHNYGRGILHVTNPFPEELAYAFLRIQESSGNPRWINRGAFTHEQFLRDFDRLIRRDICDSYPYEYVGFSVLGSAFRPFYEGKFNPVPNLERQLLGLLKRPTDSGQRKTFVIGTKEGDLDTLNHELSRSLSHVDPDYNQRTLKMIDSLPADLRGKMTSWYIRDGSFLRSIIPQEIVAEFADWDDSYVFPEMKVDKRNSALQRVRRKIKEVFEEKLETLRLQ